MKYQVCFIQKRPSIFVVQQAFSRVWRFQRRFNFNIYRFYRLSDCNFRIAILSCFWTFYLFCWVILSNNLSFSWEFFKICLLDTNFQLVCCIYLPQNILKHRYTKFCTNVCLYSVLLQPICWNSSFKPFLLATEFYFTSVKRFKNAVNVVGYQNSESDVW